MWLPEATGPEPHGGESHHGIEGVPYCCGLFWLESYTLQTVSFKSSLVHSPSFSPPIHSFSIYPLHNHNSSTMGDHATINDPSTTDAAFAEKGKAKAQEPELSMDEDSESESENGDEMVC